MLCFVLTDYPQLTCPFGMHHSLWDSFPVKVGHLVCENHILDQQRPPRSGSLQVQFVSNRMARPCGQRVWPLLQTESMLNNKTLRQNTYGRPTRSTLCLHVSKQFVVRLLQTIILFLINLSIILWLASEKWLSESATNDYSHCWLIDKLSGL